MNILKNSFVQSLLSFLAAFIVGLLLVAHLQHTVLNTFIGNAAPSASLGFYDDPAAPTANTIASSQTDEASAGGCGCPGCCAVNEVL